MRVPEEETGGFTNREMASSAWLITSRRMLYRMFEFIAVMEHPFGGRGDIK